jgi:hypothetical protein
VRKVLLEKLVLLELMVWTVRMERKATPVTRAIPEIRESKAFRVLLVRMALMVLMAWRLG